MGRSGETVWMEWRDSLKSPCCEVRLLRRHGNYRQMIERGCGRLEREAAVERKVIG